MGNVKITNIDAEENERERLVHLHYLGILNDLNELLKKGSTTSLEDDVEKCLEIVQSEIFYAEKEIDLLTDL